MRTFKYDAECFSELRKKIIVKSISVLVPAMAVGLYIGFSGQQSESNRMDVLIISIPVAVIIALAAGFGLFRGIKRQQALYASYRLTIDENAVTREQQNTQTIRLPKGEIQLITRTRTAVLRSKEKASAT
jgi:Ca2+/H+ antiporter